MTRSSNITRLEKHRQMAQCIQGAVIDSSGKEIPITDEMIQQACQQLEPYEQALFIYPQRTQQVQLYCVQ